jgi:hypothetical protein
MRSVWYNNNKVCDLTPIEYESLCLLLPYWGLQITDDEETITGALSTFMLGIQGLSQEKVKELVQLLMHTGISITTEDHVKCDQRLYVDYHAAHPMPLALNTPDKQLYYLNPATSFRLPVQSGIHKGITLKRKDGPLFLAVQPAFEEKVSEWISYLVIQSFLRFSFESLTSISESTFMSCADKVLSHINPSFAAVQMPHKNINKRSPDLTDKVIEKQDTQHSKKAKDDPFYEESNTMPAVKSLNRPKITVPPIRPFSSLGSLITRQVPKTYDHGQLTSRNAQPINPFKSVAKKEHPIQPFKPHNNSEKGKNVIRPFKPK